MVGQTGSGEPIYEIKSARLVLRGDAAHFNRLVGCSRCGREVAGRAVLGPADLDQVPQAVVCNDCVEVATESAWSPATAEADVEEPSRLDPVADAEMNHELEVLVDELGDPAGEVDLAAGAADAGDEEASELEARPVDDEDPVLEETDRSPLDIADLLEEPSDIELDPQFAELELLPLDAGEDDDDEEDERLVDLVRRIQDAIQRLSEEAGLRARLEERIEHLNADALERRSQGSENDQVLRRQVDGLVEQVEQLRATVDAEWARGKAESAALTQADETLAQTVSGLQARIEQVAEQLAGRNEAEGELAAAMSAQRSELRTGLLAGLAEVRAAMPASAEDVAGRLEDLDAQVRHARAEVGEVTELHAALDAGLGTLRGELAELRSALAREAEGRADLEDRLETYVRASLVPEGEKGRKGKKAAESTLGTLSAAVQDLLREQRQLRDDVLALERAADGVSAAATRAAAQASSIGPVRSDVELLHHRLAEQGAALDALQAIVEAQRRPTPTRAKAPARKAPATKAEASATKAPAPKRATRAKKA